MVRELYEPAQELHSRAVPSVEAPQRVNRSYTGRNSSGRRIIKKNLKVGGNTQIHKINLKQVLLKL